MGKPVLYRPRPELGHVDALTHADDTILVPPQRPVRGRVLVEQNGAHGTHTVAGKGSGDLPHDTLTGEKMAEKTGVADPNTRAPGVPLLQRRDQQGQISYCSGAKTRRTLMPKRSILAEKRVA
jgi:hypothetical protein